MNNHHFAHALYGLWGALRPFAYRFTGDLSAAEELLQETFVRAFIGRRHYKKGTNFKGWVYAIMRNTYTTRYKRGQLWHKITATRHAPLIDTARVAENEGPACLTHAEVWRAFGALPQNMRQVFLMHYRGFKYQEIANLLQLPIGTVKNRIHMARQSLQRQLAAYA